MATTYLTDTQGTPTNNIKWTWSGWVKPSMAQEQGLFFISCCATPNNFELMLQSMIVSDHKGHYDHLLDFTQAISGAAFFAPSMTFLAHHA